MPLMLNIKVTQVRETVVTANSLKDAIAIASAVLNDEEVPKTKADGTPLWGYVSKNPKETHLSAEMA